MRILHFDVVKQLGAGGMGKVFLAEDTKLHRRVALKFLPDEVAADPARLRRFTSEARTLASLNHPNIVTIHSVEQDGERTFLVMELVEGETMAERLKGKPLGLDEFFDIAIPFTDALAAAHEQGVVHRDLKPSNVMLTRDGALKILDFGLAKLAVEDKGAVASQLTTEMLTREGRVVGTPSFMSPEQLEGRAIDHRSDIFSLGIILYEMATGSRPFSGTTEAEIVSSILRDTPDSADVVRPGLPHHLSRLLRLCLEKDVDHRLQSARDLRNELLELRRELTSGELEVRPATPRPSRSRRRPLVAVLAAAAVAVLVALGVRQYLERPPTPLGLGAEAQALVDKAHLAELRGDTPKNLRAAAESYRRALELAPQSPDIAARLASVLTLINRGRAATTERAAEARSLIEIALRADPNQGLAHVAYGRLELLAGDAQAAWDAALRAQSVSPDDPSGYTLAGEALVALGRVDQGLVELRRGVELAGPDTRPRLRLARVLQDLGRENAAASEYEEVLSYDPDSSNALNNLAVIYQRTGRNLDAIPLFKRVWELEGDYAAALNLGVASYSMDRIEEAIEYFRRAHELAPDHPYPQHALGESFEKANDEESARIWYARAVRSYDATRAGGGTQPLDLGYRAVCAAKLGRVDEAVANLQEALDERPDDGELLYNAAKVYATAGDRDTAYRYAEMAIQRGYERQEFVSDLAFAEFLEDPAFRALVESRID